MPRFSREVFAALALVGSVVAGSAPVALAAPPTDSSKAIAARASQESRTGAEVQRAWSSGGSERAAMDGRDLAARLHPDGQHGDKNGHLPPTRENVQLIGKGKVLDAAPGRIGDVEIFGNYAYLAAFSKPRCTRGGVYVFDISDLRRPRRIKFLKTGPSSYVGEGVQVVRLKTRSFVGDILIHNNEICGKPTRGTVGGASLWDVTRPEQARPLALGFGDTGPASRAGAGMAHQVHSTFVWVATDKAYAILVDDEEPADVDIFNVSNPRRPVKVAEYDLRRRFPRILQRGLDEVSLHDLVVKQIDGRDVMLASYWDAGYVTLDVTNPRNPTYIGDSDFTAPDRELRAQRGIEAEPEGNAHEAEFTKDNRLFIGSDEDFAAVETKGRTDDQDTFEANQGTQSRRLHAGDKLTGTAVYAGLACNRGQPVPAPPADKGHYLAVVERGACLFSEKVANVEKVTAHGGYAGTIVVNREGRAGSPGGCRPFEMDVKGTRPAVSVDRRTGHALFDKAGEFDERACLAGNGARRLPVDLGTSGDTVTLRAVFNGWGYVHLYANGRGKVREPDTYAIPEAMNPRYADRFGDLSVHEVATSQQRDDLAYLSYYGGGFRVLRIQNEQLREVGRFIDKGGNNFWGVEVFSRGGQEYVAASDRDFGVYLFRYTGGR